jgi:hypothetical protein
MSRCAYYRPEFEPALKLLNVVDTDCANAGAPRPRAIGMQPADDKRGSLHPAEIPLLVST